MTFALLVRIADVFGYTKVNKNDTSPDAHATRFDVFFETDMDN